MKSVTFPASLLLASLLTLGCQATLNTNANSNTPATSKGGNHNGKGIDINLSREDFEKQKERFEREAKDLGQKVGKGADDLWIWSKVRAKLAYANDLRDSTINVDVDNNVVTLSGTVPSEAQKANAEQITRSVEGVASIHNQIQVTPLAANTNKSAH